jgi:hypothetical protein
MQSSRALSPTLHKVHKVEETLLIPPLLRRAIDSLDTKVLVIVTKLSLVRPAPSKSADPLHAILPHGLQPLVEIRLIVQTARTVELLVFLFFLCLPENGELEFCDCDRVAKRVPEVVEVYAEVGG